MAFSISTILAAGFALPALAQDAPLRANIDANGVDLATGNYIVPVVEGQIGSGVGKLTMVRYRGSGASARDNWTGELRKVVSGGTTTITVNLGLTSDKFTLVSGTYVPAKGNGATLVDTGSGYYVYRTAEGASVTYGSPSVLSGATAMTSNVTIGQSVGYCSSANAQDCGVPVSVVQPNQTVTTFTWELPMKCEYDSELNPISCVTYYRPKDIRNSAGYGIKIKWKHNSYSTSVPPTNWYYRDGLKLMDLSRVYCDPDATNCDSVAGPTVTYTTPSGGVEEFTDWRGGTWRFALSGSTYGVRRPGSGSDDITYTITSGKVSSVTRDGATYGYAWSTSSGILTATVTNPDTTTTAVGSDTTTGQPTTVTNGTSNTVTNTYDASGRLTRTTYPEGNYVNYTYSLSGLLTEVRRVPKSGSSLADLVTSWTYPTSCTGLACNRPEYTVDERGSRTDYTFSSTHGQLTRVQYPAPTGSVRPEENHTYTQLYAKVKDSSGTLVDSTFGSYMLTASSICATAATCAGTANETVTTYTYGTGSGIDNLQPLTVTVAAGDGSISATTTYTYDDAGNVLTVDGPLSTTADTVRYRYDSSNRLVGVVSADPDGGGSLKHRAVRYTYSSSGKLTTTEIGTVNSQSDGDWAAMTVLQTQTTTYDSDDRPIKDTLAASSTTYSVAQYSYNANKQLECSALRMNPAEFASLPSSACSLDTPGNYGEDRIVKYSYDNAGRMNKVQTGYLVTGVQADDITTTFTANGQPLTTTDAEGNKTTYSYDGHDHLTKAAYPSTTKGAGTSSSTDYEEYIYNDDGDLAVWRLRGYASDSTKHIDFSYDNIGQVTTKNLPGSELDVTYGYDFFGRMTSAATSAQTLTWSHDALSRVTSAGGPLGTLLYQYDPAGQRTRITWPDSVYASYAYLVTGEMNTISDSTSTTLATYAYDDLGRRTSLTFGNGVVTSYGYDNASRLTSLAHDLSGSTYDVASSFAYSPASAIVSRTQNNDNFAWTGHVNVARGYTSNGLNQLTASGATSLGFDVRGNLSSSGSDSYSYSSENMLTSATVSTATTTLAYDPSLRLYETVAPNRTLRYQYDGADLITEYNTSGVVQRRYIHGPNADEPLVYYEGSGTGTRYYLSADERGSVVATTTNSGVLSGNIAKFDEYGIPGAGAGGRFQYTGQVYVPSIGLYNYKARMYSPTLGRFLQADPIGYAGGMNLYNYVGSDPVNFTDPSGLDGSSINIQCSPVKVWYSPPNPDPTERDDITVENKFYYDQKCSPAGGGGGEGAAPPPNGQPPVYGQQRPGQTAPQNNQDPCPKGQKVKARAQDGSAICFTPPRPLPPPTPRKKRTPQQQAVREYWCGWGGALVGGFVGGATAVAVTGLAVETGPLAPFIGGAAGFVMGKEAGDAFNRGCSR